MWNVRPQQHLWGAVSQALRTPSLVDRGMRVEFPPASMVGSPIPVVASVFGNPAMQNERLVTTEAGYRIDLGSSATIDVTAFAGRYQSLRTYEPSAPNLALVGGRPMIFVSATFQNLLDADTRGAEITGRLALSRACQVDGTFSAFHLTPHVDAASRDPKAPTFDGDAPALQWRGHSAVSLGPRAQADVQLFHVGALGQLRIPAYTRADARLEWKMTPRLSAAVQGQNLFSAAHAEFAGHEANIVSTEVPRSGGLRLTWRF